ncbi:HD-GYP domain-containing protein [Alteromonadaceae bacterium M269]|nr:HD-GYP domain-containing protein [Alteromonadaceae bacterium M269]
MFETIAIDELLPGMFVNQVLKQTGTLKIKTQGLVKSEKSIALLKSKGILELEIDLSRSKISEDEAKEESVKENKVKKRQPDSQTFDRASNLYQQAKEIQKDYQMMVQTGQRIDLEPLRDMSLDIIDSVFENSNALCCLSLIKNADEYLLEHSLNCSILMAVFAKHLGFDKELIEELSLAGLLMDTGMATLPSDILSKAGPLTKQERSIVNTHVDIGLEIIEQSDETSDNIMNVVASHHERLDGSGYPEGKSNDEISIYGRMAAIVDTYDALTSNRPYRSALNPTAALKQLLSQYTGKLDQSLVQQFIKCLGVHPVGSLVKTTSGKLAIVVTANKEDPLKPKIMTFYHIKSAAFSETKMVDLKHIDEEIESSVRPEEFKLNLNKFFRDVFLGAL